MRLLVTLVATCAIAALGLPLLAPAAQANFKITYVASYGDDANTGCWKSTEPCRTLDVALASTSYGGKILVLDSGNFGHMIITRPVSVLAVGVDATLGRIVVEAGPTHAVYLAGLNVRNQVDPPYIGGHYGIEVKSAGALHLSNCLIQGHYDSGIRIDTAGPTEVYISDCTIADNAGFGIWARARPNGGPIEVVLERVTVARNREYGIRMLRSQARAWLNNSTVTQNGTGLATASNGQIVSFGNNFIYGNGVDGTPTTLLPLR